MNADSTEYVAIVWLLSERTSRIRMGWRSVVLKLVNFGKVAWFELHVVPKGIYYTTYPTPHTLSLVPTIGEPGDEATLHCHQDPIAQSVLL